MSNPPQFPCNAEPFLPHAAPMALLDEILACDEHSLAGRVSIDQGTLFGGPQGVPNWVGIEYMAQAIAAWSGVRASQKDEAVKIGFLVSTRRMQCAQDFFSVGSVLDIHAEMVTEAANGLATFDCKIVIDKQTVISARINVYQPDNPQAFLAGEAA